MDALLEVENLEIEFQTQRGVIQAVNGVSFSLAAGETLGIVGESGCGKSVSMLSLLQLIPQPPGRITNGRAMFQGRNLLEMSVGKIRDVRGVEIGMVFQDPMTSLNPVLTVGRQLTEIMERHLKLSPKQSREYAMEMLDLVGIPQAGQRLSAYPHQFSGGMRQRVMIAMALACKPKLLIADEPTTALDVTIQAEIVDLILELKEQLGMAVIWITHDLAVLARLAERVMVMYAGYVVEEANTLDLFTQVGHPYTRGLLNSLPRTNETGHRRLVPIEGLPPELRSLPKGCPFFPRCQNALHKCAEQKPPLEIMGEGHRKACWIDIQGG